MKRHQSEEIRKELRELAPGLEKVGRREAFDVPEDYFGELERRIMAATTGAGRVRQFSTRRVLAWAASFLLLVTAAWATYRFIVEPIIAERSGQDVPVLADQQASDNASTIIRDQVPESLQGIGAGEVSPHGPIQEPPPAAQRQLPQTAGQATQGLPDDPGRTGYPGGNSSSGDGSTSIRRSQAAPASWGDTTICMGAVIQYESPVNGNSYQWVLDGKPATSVSDPSFRVSASVIGGGLHILELAVHGRSGERLSSMRANILVLTPLPLDLGADRCVEDGFRLSLTPSRSHNFLWSDGSRGSSLPVTSGGTYWVRASHNALPGCSSSDTVKLTVLTEPRDQFPPVMSFCNDEQVRLSVKETLPGYTYSWEPGDIEGKTLFLRDEVPGTYTYTLLSSACGRTFREDIVIHIDDCLIDIPNVFTPNGDGSNDRFIIGNIDAYPGVHLVVMDRNGRRVFEDNNYRNTWDGAGCAEGTYYYILRLTKGTQSERSGTVTILR